MWEWKWTFMDVWWSIGKKMNILTEIKWTFLRRYWPYQRETELLGTWEHGSDRTMDISGQSDHNFSSYSKTWKTVKAIIKRQRNWKVAKRPSLIACFQGHNLRRVDPLPTFSEKFLRESKKIGQKHCQEISVALLEVRDCIHFLSLHKKLPHI